MASRPTERGDVDPAGALIQPKCATWKGSRGIVEGEGEVTEFREEEEVVLEPGNAGDIPPTGFQRGGEAVAFGNGDFNTFSFPIVTEETELLLVGRPVAVIQALRERAPSRPLAVRNRDYRPRRLAREKSFAWRVPSD
jgi:hypothetical protein